MINQQIRLIRQLGAGGMGSVWAAEHLRLGCEVAVKFLSPQHLHIPEVRARFQSEARAINQARSPHVVQVLDQGVTDDGVPYLVLELLDGEDLGQYLARVDHLRLAEAGAIVEQLCRALSKAHRAGVVHRDIKPENVFLVREPDGPPFVKLLDFGIAKDVTREGRALTETGSWLGSAYYMSPEQLRDPKRIDAQTDNWAVCALIYQLLTGDVPFDGESWATICNRVCSGKFAPVSHMGLGLPAELDAFFARGLHVDKEQRFASIDELGREFERIVRLHTSVVISRSGQAASLEDTLPGATRQLPRPLPPRRALGWIVAGLLVLIGLGMFWRRQRPPLEPPQPIAATPSRAADAAAPAISDGDALERAEPPRVFQPAAPSGEAPPPAAAVAPPSESAPPRPTKPKPKPAVADQPASGRKYRGF